MNNQYLDVQMTFKTVAEFRSAKATNSCAHDEACDVPQACEVGVDVVFEQESQNTESYPSVPLHCFDADCSPTVPSSYSGEENECQSGSSALSQFMSKAVDIESAFEYAGKISGMDDGQWVVAEHGNAVYKPTEACANKMPSIDASAVSTTTETITSSTTVARKSEQTVVLKDPQESSGTTFTVELDAHGRVVKSLFCGGEMVHFQYDDNGDLKEFNYAAIQWTKNEDGWSAQDRQSEYALDGRITVLANGSIRIEREDVVRVLKVSGTRIDEHKSGSRTESRKIKNKPSPYDLLAKAKAVSSIWLNSRSPFKSGSEQSFPAPLKLDLVNDNCCSSTSEQSTARPMILPQAKVPASTPAVLSESSLSCAATPPIELKALERTDKLRSLEDTLLESNKDKLDKTSIKLQVLECWLKSQLWLTDRMAGQSSPRHLAQLDCLAQMYLEQQKNDLAELTHFRALHIREQYFGKGQPELAASVRGLANIYVARGNFARAEEMYKEAIELQENGLRKILFLYSERVTDEAKLCMQLDELFSSVTDLSCLYASQGRQQLCAVVYEKALALAAEIAEREPSAKQVLNESINVHLEAMKDLSVA